MAAWQAIVMVMVMVMVMVILGPGVNRLIHCSLICGNLVGTLGPNQRQHLQQRLCWRFTPLDRHCGAQPGAQRVHVSGVACELRQTRLHVPAVLAKHQAAGKQRPTGKP